MAEKDKIWFKAKTYGYGWYPTTWQGWVIIFAYLIILSALVYIFQTDVERFLVFYLISVFVITSLLIYISYKKGEKARWRWGKDK